MEAAAKELKALGAIPFAAYCTDPCDGRTQGTTGMFDSLPYRNDAAIIFRRLIRSLPTRSGRHRRRHLRQGPARDDDGAGRHARSALRAGARRRHAARRRRRGRRQGADRIGARFAHGEITLEDAADMRLPRLRLARRRLPVPGHGGHLAGGRRGARHVAAALGAGALRTCRSGSTWRGVRRAPCCAWRTRGTDACATSSPTRRCTTRMVVHAAFGGSTNLILHMPAIAHAAGLRAPTVGRLGAHQPPGAAPGRRAAQRPDATIPPCRCSWRAACPR